MQHDDVPYRELSDALIRQMAEELVTVPGIEAVALGGSRARGTHTASSDYDLGLYYTESAHGVRAAAGAVHRAVRSGRGQHGSGGRRADHAVRRQGRVTRRRHRGSRSCGPADQRVHAEEARDQQRGDDEKLQPGATEAGFVARGLHNPTIPRWRIPSTRRVRSATSSDGLAGIPSGGIWLPSYSTHWGYPTNEEIRWLRTSIR